ncbi:MAG: hypothetical protein C0398_01780 [Coprothermobacter sp.]|nr:hypothetical protein [Coprothermobacter sp.]
MNEGGIWNRLQEADVLLEELQRLRDSYDSLGGIAHIYDVGHEKDLARVRSYVDGFLFVLVSTKDMLLQEVNRQYHLGLLAHEVCEKRLVRAIGQQNSSLVAPLNNLQMLQDRNASTSDPKFGWYVRLTRYRNAATHRGVLYQWPAYSYASGAAPQSAVYLMEDPDDLAKGPYQDYDLIGFFVSVRANMETALARWAVDLGLKTALAP